jgi:hypothetical protein
MPVTRVASTRAGEHDHRQPCHGGQNNIQVFAQNNLFDRPCQWRRTAVPQQNGYFDLIAAPIGLASASSLTG